MTKLKEKLTDSPFNLKTIFESVRIQKYFEEKGITMDDIQAAKVAIIQEQLQEQLQDQPKQTNAPKPPKSPKTDTALKVYSGRLLCPDCGGKLYIRSICPGCEEGKSGKKLRFICENFPECNFEEAN